MKGQLLPSNLAGELIPSNFAEIIIYLCVSRITLCHSALYTIRPLPGIHLFREKHKQWQGWKDQGSPLLVFILLNSPFYALLLSKPKDWHSLSLMDMKHLMTGPERNIRKQQWNVTT